MNFNLLDLSFFGVFFKIILIVIIYIIIVSALKIMSRDIKRGVVKGGSNLGWKLKLVYPGDGGNFVEGDIVPIGNKLTIGRNKNNQMILPSPSVSNYHAKIYFEDGRYMLEDLNSTNGTFINGIMVDKKSLQPGDEISISKTLLLVTDDE